MTTEPTYPISHVRVLPATHAEEEHPREQECGPTPDRGWACWPAACSQPTDCPLNG